MVGKISDKKFHDRRYSPTFHEIYILVIWYIYVLPYKWWDKVVTESATEYFSIQLIETSID